MKHTTPEMTSFVINKAITTSYLFSQVKISVSAKLVLRCIVDYWNFKLGYAYPTQATIIKCTGLSQASVVNAIKELSSCELINITRDHKRNYYNFTYKFYRYLDLIPPNFSAHTSKFYSNITLNFRDNNILKEKEKTRKYNFLNSSFSENISTPVGQPRGKYIGLENKTTGLSEEGAYSNEQVEVEEDRGLIMAKAMVKNMVGNDIFARKVEELKKKYNLDDNGEVINSDSSA